jgi:hypothetical protein
MIRKLTIATAIVGCSLLAGVADAGALKSTFRDVTFPDNTVGTIRAGSKITNKAGFTQCDYYDTKDGYLGAFSSADFATTDPTALEDFCWSHYYQRN